MIHEKHRGYRTGLSIDSGRLNGHVVDKKKKRRRFGPGRDHFGRAVNAKAWLEDPSKRLGMNGPGDDGRGIHDDYVHAAQGGAS